MIKGSSRTGGTALDSASALSLPHLAVAHARVPEDADCSSQEHAELQANKNCSYGFVTARPAGNGGPGPGLRLEGRATGYGGAAGISRGLSLTHADFHHHVRIAALS